MIRPDPFLDDKHRWSQLREGNAVALSELMRMHYPALYHYGCTFCRQPDAVKDVIQDVFFDLWQGREHLPGVTYVRTYLLTALRNRLINTLQRSARLSLRGDWTDADQSRFAGEFTVETQLIIDEREQEQTRRLQQELGRLSKRQREVIYLRFYQGLDNEAIATLMQVNRQSVANLISGAIQRLRDGWGVILSLLLACRFFTP